MRGKNISWKTAMEPSHTPVSPHPANSHALGVGMGWRRALTVGSILASFSLGCSLAQAATPTVQPTYAACAKSSDIDGKGTYELFGSDGWIF